MSKKSAILVSILMGLVDAWLAPKPEPKAMAPSRKKEAPEPFKHVPAFNVNLFQYSEYVSVDTIKFILDNLGNEILNAEDIEEINFSKAHIVLACARLSPIPVEIKLGSEIARAVAYWLRYSK